MLSRAKILLQEEKEDTFGPSVMDYEFDMSESEAAAEDLLYQDFIGTEMDPNYE